MRPYPVEHNERWIGFEHRSDDIVISTRSKCGTTWLQMIAALLVFESPDLPAPLGAISPWLDWEVEPLGVVRARLEAQSHRRIIKTHTPLDGLPLDDRVTYIVVGRRPLDVAVSLYHHARNIDRTRVAELAGRAVEASPVQPFEEWVDGWLRDDWVSTGRLDSLSGLVHHVSDAWERAGNGARVLLVHYDDLTADLEATMCHIANRLGVPVATVNWPSLVAAATFTNMKASSDQLAPDHSGVLLDHDAFFRGGRIGDGDTAVSGEQRGVYRERLTEQASTDVVRWLDPSLR